MSLKATIEIYPLKIFDKLFYLKYIMVTSVDAKIITITPYASIFFPKS